MRSLAPVLFASGSRAGSGPRSAGPAGASRPPGFQAPRTFNSASGSPLGAPLTALGEAPVLDDARAWGYLADAQGYGSAPPDPRPPACPRGGCAAPARRIGPIAHAAAGPVGPLVGGAAARDVVVAALSGAEQPREIAPGLPGWHRAPMVPAGVAVAELAGVIPDRPGPAGLAVLAGSGAASAGCGLRAVRHGPRVSSWGAHLKGCSAPWERAESSRGVTLTGPGPLARGRQQMAFWMPCWGSTSRPSCRGH